MNSLDFTALDFETSNNEHFSICQVGLVVVRNGTILKKYSSLVKPPKNEYSFHNIKVHHIEPFMTLKAPTFKEVWLEISKYIDNQLLVSHNSNFDLTKLEETLNFYKITVPAYSHTCTYKIFGKNLKECCKDHGIDFFNHHDALADAEACAKLYLKSIGVGESDNTIDSFVPFSSKKIEKEDLVPDFNIGNINNPFYRKKVVFTGDLAGFSRREAAHKVKCLGGDVNTSISKKTDFVVIGKNPGPSKMIKIEKLEIPIVSEEQFLKMLMR